MTTQEDLPTMARQDAQYSPDLPLHKGYTVDALALVKRTASYPREAQFLQQASEQQKKEFADAVRSGHIGLTALFSNQLTGICRPEELLRLTDYARRFAEAFGIVTLRCGDR